MNTKQRVLFALLTLCSVIVATFYFIPAVILGMRAFAHIIFICCWIFVLFLALKYIDGIYPSGKESK